MALTVSSPFLSSLARQRAAQEAARLQVAGAVNQGVGALSDMEKKKREDEATARDVEAKRLEQGIRLREVEEQGAQQKFNNEHALRLEAADRERDNATREHNRLIEGLRLKEIADANDAAGQKARAAEEQAGAAERDRQAKILVRAMRNQDGDEQPATIEKLQALGLSDEEIQVLRSQDFAEQHAAELADQRAQAEIAAISRKNEPRAAAAPRAQAPRLTGADVPRDVSSVKQGRAVSMATATIDRIETALNKYEAAEQQAGATGRLTGRARKLLTGYIPGLNENERTEFLANAEALNAMIFPILGRQDAPTETEVKRLAPLQVNETDTPTELRAKIRTIRQMLTEQSHMVPMAGGRAPAPTAAAPDDDADAEAFLGGG